MNKYGEVLENVSLKNYSTFKIGGNTKYLIYPTDIENLKLLIEYLNNNHLKYLVIGNGSNVLFPDEDYDGVIIKLDKINNLSIKEQKVTVESGYYLPKLVMETINHNLKGLEFAAGIPASLGGSIVSNAGAYLSSMFDFIESVKVLNENLEIIDLPKEQIDYSYRYTMFKNNKKIIVLGCTLKLSLGDKQSSMNLLEDRKARRLASQPLDYPSVGSIFCNPENDHAGRLIEECGLKGYNVGGALVSPKHANFIVNNGGATEKDVITLINYIKNEVKNKFNIELKSEVKIIKW